MLSESYSIQDLDSTPDHFLVVFGRFSSAF